MASEPYKNLLVQAAEALAAEAQKPRHARLTRAEIARRAGVSVPWLALLRAGTAQNASYRGLHAVLRVLAEGREHESVPEAPPEESPP